MNSSETSIDIEAKLKELYMQALTGNKTSYEEFLFLSSIEIKRVLHFMAGKTIPRESLEDLHQETLLKIHHKKTSYRTNQPILPWIRAISRYTFIDFYRAQKRLPISVELDHLLASPLVDSGDVNMIFDLLTDDEKSLIEKIKLDQKSYREVAREMNVSETALKTRFHRLMKNLKGRIS